MADGMIFTGGILLVMVAGRQVVVRGKMRLMHMLMMRALLRRSGMAIPAFRMHGDGLGQGIAAEQRQPDGQEHCNKFSDGVRHARRVAKFF